MQEPMQEPDQYDQAQPETAGIEPIGQEAEE